MIDLKVEQTVYIDADVKEWGRVTGRAIVMENSNKRRKTVLVNAEQISAGIIVRKDEVTPC
jgi:hypothetical protein